MMVSGGQGGLDKVPLCVNEQQPWCGNEQGYGARAAYFSTFVFCFLKLSGKTTHLAKFWESKFQICND